MKKSILLLVGFMTSMNACSPKLLPTPTPTAWDAPQVTESIISGAPTVEPTLATLQLAVYPPGARTAIPELDTIIDALLRHDFPVLKRLSSYLQIGCTLQDGLGGPPKCQGGETEGTMVEVIPFLGPEGYHSRQEDYEGWQGPDVLGLLAAYSTSEGTYTDPAYPAGEYALVFLLADSAQTITLQISEGKIIRYDYYFDVLTETDLISKSREMILPLNFKPIPTAVPWQQLHDPLGRFSLVYPPHMELLQGDQEWSWHLGKRIRVEVLSYEGSWIMCFYGSMDDCAFVESDQIVVINNQNVRRIEGYIGSVGGNTNQEFLSYIFDLGKEALVMTVYALPFGIQANDPTFIWPLEGMELELFQRTVETVLISD